MRSIGAARAVGFSFMEKPFQVLLGLEQVVFAPTNEVGFIKTGISLQFFSVIGRSIRLR